MLDNGIISYYDSQDDVCKGSKGSIKMSVCEIKGEIILMNDTLYSVMHILSHSFNILSCIPLIT